MSCIPNGLSADTRPVTDPRLSKLFLAIAEAGYVAVSSVEKPRPSYKKLGLGLSVGHEVGCPAVLGGVVNLDDDGAGVEYGIN